MDAAAAADAIELGIRGFLSGLRLHVAQQATSPRTASHHPGEES
jgi:hypothetical protein